jgi:hypothetical protein
LIFFGDTLVGKTAASHQRKSSVMIHNSIASALAKRLSQHVLVVRHLHAASKIILQNVEV